ncbi:MULTISPECIES: restriction endonuclease [Rhodanobacter]|uniref:restriction endonuclease n=1 Tax=Rhodanobacter TaxID=75309 RepID=UPI000AA030C7|nr:restriction endonuclease [Rhodanobacter thiooxydans]UJJ55064.1 restriction endonuclease [Rhodanobacter thiooxydans]
MAFQAKRYKDTVTRSAVGEFHNALLGRAEKGVFITTGRFTPDGEAEATRDGVVPIELIDDGQLVEPFQDKLIGIRPKMVYEVDHAFFDEFRRES